MTSLFASKPKVDQKAIDAQNAAQRRQDATINKQSAAEAVDLGTRRRLLAAQSAGRNSLFATTGAAGVPDQTTLG